MECKKKGPWHLGISSEACKNAGGRYIRSPCNSLKDMIRNRPSRMDLENPQPQSCQNSLKRIETSFVSTREISFGASPSEACDEFCKSLPDYSQQTGMLVHSLPLEGTSKELFNISGVGNTEVKGNGEIIVNGSSVFHYYYTQIPATEPIVVSALFEDFYIPPSGHTARACIMITDSLNDSISELCCAARLYCFCLSTLLPLAADTALIL